jgi:hypothetical protein
MAHSKAKSQNILDYTEESNEHNQDSRYPDRDSNLDFSNMNQERQTSTHDDKYITNISQDNSKEDIRKICCEGVNCLSIMSNRGLSYWRC